jgi:hypothetical protein
MVHIMKHSNDKDGKIFFSQQGCSCNNCYVRARDVIVAELESLNILERKEPDIMRLSAKFADALPHSDDNEIENITNQDIWGTLISRFNQSEPDAIHDYGIVIRMIIDILIEKWKEDTTNKHGGDMYGV